MGVIELHPSDRMARLESRLHRERRARQEAERLLEGKSRELFEANETLKRLATSLEERVKERTDELTLAHRRAIDLVQRDPLTGLANRGRFTSAANEILDRCRLGNHQAAFVIVDIDHFKQINDTYGHEAGDTLLQHVARQFLDVTRTTDVVARVGGDEFCIVYPGLDDKPTLEAVLERLSRALQQPVVYAGRPLFPEASMGVALFPDHGDSLDEVMRHADLALYASKQSGRGTCTAFDRVMRDKLEQRLKMEADLKAAMTAGGLEPWLQPIIDMSTGRSCGAEALVRWRRDDGSILPPGAFLDLVEECGLMPAMFSRILRLSLMGAREHVATGRLQYVTVNVSPSQFESDTVLEDVKSALAETGYPAHALVLEITEEVLLTDFERARRQLQALVDLGITIALDDFGHGYANIAYLRQLPIHMLKLDRSMTADVVSDARALSIVSCVAQLAHALDMKIIAEGVEGVEQGRALQNAGCPFQQGYHYARPMPVADLADVLGRRLG